VTHPYWPVQDLRLRTADLELRPLTESDLAPLADLLPADVELDPDATTYAIDARTQRGVVIHQTYWRAYGTWRPQEWRLNFAVTAGGRLIGNQELEGNDFAALRTVDTSSFLAPEARGHGFGKQMRRAVLALAFGPMRAQAAITSAWHDNHASLGVSRALGYLPNGASLHRRGDVVDEFTHLRLTRAGWLAGGAREPVAISGYEPCRPFFGLGEDAHPGATSG